MKVLKKSLIVLIVTVIAMFFLLRDNLKGTLTLLLETNKLYILIGLLLGILHKFLQALAIKKILDHNEEKNSLSLKKCFKFVSITKFFNGITPFSAGGEPLEIMLLRHNGIQLSKGTGYVILNSFFFQISVVFWGVTTFLINIIFNVLPVSSRFNKFWIFGFTTNLIIATLMLILLFSNFGIKVLMKLKNRFFKRFRKEEAMEDFEETLKNYRKSSQFLKIHKKESLKIILCQIAALFSRYIIIYFVLFSLGIQNIGMSIIGIFLAIVMVLFVSGFVPIPGSSGGIEYIFMYVFSTYSILSKKELSAIVIIWRFITYYVPVISGAIFFNLSDERKKL